MPVDRLKNFLEKLAQAGLVNLTERGDVFYVLTVRGVDFLESYWKMKSFLSTLEE
jgi:predicted transcriptional regulator